MILADKIKKNISKSNARLFFAILLLTSGIWLIIQLSKTYSKNASLKIDITDIPIDRVIDNKTVQVNYKITANGFKLLWLDLKTNRFDVKFSNFKEKGDHYNLNMDKVTTLVSNKFVIKEKNIEFEQDNIRIDFSERMVKKVDVKPQLSYTFASGYNTIDRIKTTPDSVKISGKKNEVAKLSYLKTENVSVENIDDTISLKVKLKVPSSNINVGIDKVEIHLPVQKFTEDEKILPINLINVPDSLQVNYFPKNVSINYLVPISKYNKINEEQFKIECDFNEKFINQGILIPELVKRPNNIKNISINPYKIEYLIKK